MQTEQVAPVGEKPVHRQEGRRERGWRNWRKLSRWSIQHGGERAREEMSLVRGMTAGL